MHMPGHAKHDDCVHVAQVNRSNECNSPVQHTPSHVVAAADSAFSSPRDMRRRVVAVQRVLRERCQFVLERQKELRRWRRRWSADMQACRRRRASEAAARLQRVRQEMERYAHALNAEVSWLKRCVRDWRAVVREKGLVCGTGAKDAVLLPMPLQKRTEQEKQEEGVKRRSRHCAEREGRELDGVCAVKSAKGEGEPVVVGGGTGAKRSRVHRAEVEQWLRDQPSLYGQR